VIFSGFQSLPTRDIQELRSKLSEEGVGYQVVKLSLLKLAMKRAKLDTGSLNFRVPVSVSISADDEVAPARILHDFAKTHDKLSILGGIMDGQMIDESRVKALAALPTKQELRGQVVYVISSPLRGLVSVLQGNMRGLINVLNAKAKLSS
jgi:large subunit ribosomal protein L10